MAKNLLSIQDLSKNEILDLIKFQVILLMMKEILEKKIFFQTKLWQMYFVSPVQERNLHLL